MTEAGGPSRSVVVTYGEKQVLTMLEAIAQDCLDTIVSIPWLLSVEQQKPDYGLGTTKR